MITENELYKSMLADCANVILKQNSDIWTAELSKSSNKLKLINGIITELEKFDDSELYITCSELKNISELISKSKN